MSLRQALGAGAGAVAFLTRIPVGRHLDLDRRDVARGACLFPLVGAAVGGITGLVADVLADGLPSLAAAALGVGVGVILTGAMHLDGLADAADGLGGATRERSLEIMRDHAVGAYGVVAVVLVCIVDVTLIAWLAERGDAAVVALAAAAAGRGAMLVVGVVLPYARDTEGQGRLLDSVGPVAAVVGAVLAVLLCIPAGWAGLAGAAAAAFVAAGVGALAWSRLRGATGDVLGAVAKLAETAALLAAVAVL